MRRFKKVMSFLLAVMLVFSVMATTVLAAGEPTIRVSEANAKPGDTVDITVSLENNPGIINLKLNVAYDSTALTLTGRTDANIFGTAFHAPVNESNPASNPYILSWANDTVEENLTVTGTLVTLRFKVNEGAAAGKHDITVSYKSSDIYDIDLKPVAFTVVSGAITVEAESHTVTFNANGGSGTMSEQTASSQTALTLNAFTRTGYNFSGWNTAANGSGTAYSDGANYSFAADITLYAQWIERGPAIVVSEASAKPGDTVDITVSLEKNPGIINLKLNVAYDSNVLTLTGRTDANIFGTAYHAPINQSNPAANPYILSWANDTVEENLTVNGTLITLTFKVAENAAYGRHGIAVTYKSSDVYDIDFKPVAFTVVNGAITVEADGPVSHTVTFNANGGSGTMSPQTASTQTALTANAFTRAGYMFSGWNTAANGSGTAYSNGANYSFAADITLYAQWTVISQPPTDGPVMSNYTVTFDANGGKTPVPASKIVTYGSSYGQLATASRPGYKLAGWFTAAIGGSEVTAATVVTTTSNHTLYAHWTPTPIFNDVKSTDWFYDAVMYVVDAGLFNGTSATTFSPNSPMTRAMMVTVLYRLDGAPAVSGENPFDDVAAGTWYTDAVIWAAQNGIVTGYDADTFGPEDYITREQMATILHRYSSYKGYDITASNNLAAYTDAGEVSAWALPAMKWAVAEGLIVGVTTTSLDPTANASRATVATILMRFVENITK